MSSLQAIHTFHTKDPLVLTIKNKLTHLDGLAYIAHVSSHTGVIGNENADALAKEGTFLNVTKTQLPLPKSYIKTFFKSKILPS